MKTILQNRLFLVINTGIFIIILIGLYWLKEKGFINFPEIDKVQLYQNKNYSLGAQEFFCLPRTYSRFWDIVLLPPFLLLIFFLGSQARVEANPWIIGLETSLILLLVFTASSGILAIAAGAAFATVCGFAFGEQSGIFVSLILGLIVGLIAFGLLFGLIISGLSWLSFLLIKKLVM